MVLLTLEYSVYWPNKRLKPRGLRPLDSQQVARRLGVR